MVALVGVAIPLGGDVASGWACFLDESSAAKAKTSDATSGKIAKPGTPRQLEASAGVSTWCGVTRDQARAVSPPSIRAH